MKESHLKVVSAKFLLPCFVFLKESTLETTKNVSFTLKDSYHMDFQKIHMVSLNFFLTSVTNSNNNNRCKYIYIYIYIYRQIDR